MQGRHEHVLRVRPVAKAAAERRRIHGRTRPKADVLSKPDEQPKYDLCLVMCSATKSGAAARSRDLYKSERFISDRVIAEKGYSGWRILSGRHGILSPSAWIKPYDCDLDSSSGLTRTLWRLRLTFQLLGLLGLTKPASVSVRARGYYLQGCLTALSALGFREDPLEPIDGHGSVLRVRRTSHAG